MRRKLIVLVLLLISLLPAGSLAAAEDEVNTLKVVSVTSDNAPLTGFSYELVNPETGEKWPIRLKDSHQAELTLADGNYVLKETGRPENYKQAKDISFSFPYETEPGIYTRDLLIYPKHNYVPPEPAPQTGDRGVGSDFLYLGLVSGLLLLLILLEKKERKDRVR